MAPPVNNSAAAAEARIRAAEEARRRAAEAARKAAEAQAKAAAEKAQKAAEAQRQKAAEAQQKARADAKAASDAADKAQAAKTKRDEAQKKASDAQSLLESKLRTADVKGPRMSEQERKDLSAATKDAQELKGDADKAGQQLQQAQQEATEAKNRANASHKTAIAEANKAIESQKTANTAAKAAGKPQPFATANKVRDAFDAGSLDTKAQEKLFGTKSVVSSQEAARSDAKAVSEATQRSPAEGAKELRRQLSANNDPSYRDTLMKESKGSVDAMTEGLGRPDVSQEQAHQLVRDLSHAADLTSPQASREVADSFRRAQSAEGTGSAVQDKLNSALKAGAEDPAVARVAKGLTDGFRAEGQYDKADAITQLDPKLEKTAAQSTGETRARDELDIQNAKESKDTVAAQQKQMDSDTRGQVDNLFKAAKDKKPPEGFEAVETNDPNRVEFVRKDKKGELTERISASRDDKNNVTLDTSSVDPKSKQATREVVTSSGPEGTTSSQKATWKPDKGQDLRNSPSIEDLKKSRDKSVSVEESSVSRDKGDLVTKTYKQGGGGVEGSETRFSQQKGEGGLDDKFKDKFNEDKPIDKVETKSYSIPPPGTKGPDKKPAEPTYTRTQTFSQGEGSNEVQATSTASKSLKSDDGFKVDKGPRNSQDLEQVSKKLQSKDGEDGEKFDGDKDSPKQWVLEKTDGNKYTSQTFLEGQKDISVTTERIAKGNTVEETVKGKVFGTQGDKKGEPVEISSKSSRTYNDKGLLTSAQSESTGPDGVTTKQDYKRTEKVGPGGRLQVDERSNTTRTPPGGEPTKVTSERTRRASESGTLQLVNASKYVEGPDGSAQVRVSPDKTELYVNGKPIPEGQEGTLGKKEKALLDATRGEMAKELYSLATAPEPGSAKEELIKKPETAGDWKQAASSSKDALGLLQQGALARLEGGPEGPGNGSEGPGNESGTEGASNESGTTPASRLSRLARAAQVGSEGLGIVGNTIGALSAGADLVNNISQGNYVAAVQNAADVGAGASGIAQGVNSIRNGSSLAAGIEGAGGQLGGLAGLRAASTTASGFRTALAAGGKLGVAGAALGVVAGGMDVVGGIKDGDGWQVAKGGVSIAGAIGAGVAVGAIGGPVGAGVGLAIGLGVYGAGKLFDKLSDKDHQIADVKI